LIAFVAVAACGGGPTINARELAKIMPSATDAPVGSSLQALDSGPKTLDEFVSATDVRRKLHSLGFRVGYTSIFTSPTFPADPANAPPGARLYGAYGAVFRDSGAAARGLEFYRKRVRSKAKDASPVLTEEFGKDAFAYRFASLEGTTLPGVVYFWRVGNALFEAVGVGNPDPSPEAVRVLAHRIDTRARAS